MAEDTHARVTHQSRILVAIDNSPRGRAAMQAALRLAVQSQAELQGLFVEDEDLLRLASLPCTREIDLASASSHQPQANSMERALRLAAKEAEQAFEAALKNSKLNWAFRVLRGNLAETPLAAASGYDLLVIGQRGRAPTAWASHYLRKLTASEGPVVVLFDGSHAAMRAIELGCQLARPFPIRILVLADDDAAGNQKECLRWLAIAGQNAEFVQITSNGLLAYFRLQRPAALLANRDSKLLTSAQLSRLVNEIDSPLILC
ncbi:MAG: universal stress protein [bacterium]|nr:universal stress protein [bacterium]